MKKPLVLELPLPPSVNKYLIWAPNLHRFIHSKDAREYLDVNSLLVKLFCKKNKIKPIDCYKEIDLFFYLPRSNSDSHNYLKLIFDCLQRGGLFSDDRYIMNCTKEIKIDSKCPRVLIEI